MTDRSKIIRHPDVVMAELIAITDSLAALNRRLVELGQQLEQVSAIAYEMMKGNDK
jgi:hypothetical protein